MKKLVAVLVVFALAVGVVSAQTYFAAWGQTQYFPVWYDGTDEEVYTQTSVGWGADPNFGFNFSISGDEIGFDAYVDFVGHGRNSAGTPKADGNLRIWYQPNDMLKLSLGWARADQLRGAGAGGNSFSDYAGGGKNDEDNVFPRMSVGADWFATPGPGALVEFTMDNLFIAAAIASAIGGWAEVAPEDWQLQAENGALLEDALKSSSFALGYTIPDMGLFRVGYFGSSPTVQGDEPGAIHAAFRLDAVQNLHLDIGFAYGLDNELIAIAADVGYRMDAILIGFGTTAFLDDGDLSLNLGLNLSYDADFGTLGLGTGFSYDGDDFNWNGINLYVQKNVSGGSFKTGVVVGKNEADDIFFGIPIELTVSIW